MVDEISEVEIKFKLGINITNLTLAYISLLLHLVYFYSRKRTLNILPRSLRWYMNTCYFSSSVIYAIGSIYYITTYMINPDSDKLVSFNIVRLFISGISQMLRISLLFLVIERLIATVYLERYTQKISHFTIFLVLTFLTITCSILHFIPNMLWLFFKQGNTVYTITVYYIFGIHLLTILIGRALFSQNKKIYRMLAYRVTLQRRHQIAENVKVLKFLQPTIILFSFIAPLAPLCSLSYVWITGHTAPQAMFHGIYNFTIIVIILSHLKYIRKISATTPVMVQKKVATVVSPFGYFLPTSMSTEAYFKSLKKTWN